MPQEEKKKPIKQYRSGAISVSIWRQDGERGAFYNATAQRAFKPEGADKWEHTSSFNRDDLMTAAKLLDLAHTWIIRQEEKDAFDRAQAASGANEIDAEYVGQEQRL